MLKKAQFFCMSAFMAVALFTLAACGGGSGITTITSVAITPTTISVPLNTTSEFTATVNLSDSTTTTNTSVTWQVNGVAGGSATTGTIAASPTDDQLGVYTAPAVVPVDNNGQVNITAVATQTTSTTGSTTTTVTSNTAVVTVTAGLGLTVTPATTTVPAGGSHQFTATLNSVTDPNATWSISSLNGGDIGKIDPTTGIYTAPFFPPPGGSITVTAKDGSSTATGTATITYSAASLKGPFAFSYSGDNSLGFYAVAGSFVTDGSGNIVSGVEDTNSFQTGILKQVPISGTYVVGPDGRGTATINSGLQSGGTLQFALTTNQHASLIRFDKNTTGSGSIDQQDLDDLTTSPSVVTGPYVFSVAGANSGFSPMGIAGRFTASGTGSIPATGTILDLNNNGSVTAEDTTLNGTYGFDMSLAGTGRGTITLTSKATGSIQYAYYVIDNTRLHLVEIDSAAFLAGDMYSGLAGNSFTAASLASGNYPFTTGGTSSTGAYASGGVFVSSGSGNVSSGATDTNNAGAVQMNTALGSCAYAVDSATGRIDLKLFSGSGTCPSGASTSIAEFAVYQTSLGSAVMLELDSAAVSNGLAFKQQTTPAATAVTGIFALNLAGQGVFHNSPSSYQPDVNGQLTLNGSSVAAGALDINNFNSIFRGDPVSTTGSSMTAPDATLGRGTATIEGTNPDVTFNFAYYIVDGNTAVLLGQDTVRTATGVISRQSPPPPQ